MTQFVMRGPQFPLLPWVEEAIARLGYFHEAAAPALAEMIERRWGGGAKMLFAIRDEWAPLLTEKGCADPDHAAKATSLRVHFMHLRAGFEARAPGWAAPDSKVMLIARAEFTCSTMQGQDQKVFPWRTCPVLPQPNCDREYCPCHFLVACGDA